MKYLLIIFAVAFSHIALGDIFLDPGNSVTIGDEQVHCGVEDNTGNIVCLDGKRCARENPNPSYGHQCSDWEEYTVCGQNCSQTKKCGRYSANPSMPGCIYYETEVTCQR